MQPPSTPSTPSTPRRPSRPKAPRNISVRRSLELRGKTSVKLPRAFYDRPTLDVASDIVGKVLVHERRGVRTSGAIVEVEAYIGESDPACHAALGPTRRNEPLYGAPGHAYVYLNYSFVPSSRSKASR
jgi:hypothetical protein